MNEDIEENNIIYVLEDMIKSYKNSKKNILFQNEEIFFWRNKFLSQNKIDNIRKEYFLSLPSINFMQKSPDEHINDLLKTKKE